LRGRKEEGNDHLLGHSSRPVERTPQRTSSEVVPVGGDDVYGIMSPFWTTPKRGNPEKTATTSTTKKLQATHFSHLRASGKKNQKRITKEDGPLCARTGRGRTESWPGLTFTKGEEEPAGLCPISPTGEAQEGGEEKGFGHFFAGRKRETEPCTTNTARGTGGGGIGSPVSLAERRGKKGSAALSVRGMKVEGGH